MASKYILKHPTNKAGAASAGSPWVYFVAETVHFQHSKTLNKMPRPNTDVKVRKRHTRSRVISIVGAALGDDLTPREVGVDSGSGITGTGKDVMEKLEDAWATWDDSGSSRLVVGTKQDGTDKFYDGVIEGLLFTWEPRNADDEAPVRKFNLQFQVATVA